MDFLGVEPSQRLTAYAGGAEQRNDLIFMVWTDMQPFLPAGDDELLYRAAALKHSQFTGPIRPQPTDAALLRRGVLDLRGNQMLSPLLERNMRDLAYGLLGIFGLECDDSLVEGVFHPRGGCDQTATGPFQCCGPADGDDPLESAGQRVLSGR